MMHRQISTSISLFLLWKQRIDCGRQILRYCLTSILLFCFPHFCTLYTGEDHPHAHVFAKPDASDQTLSSSSSPVHEEDIPPPLPHKGLSLAESLSEDRRPYTGEAAPIDKEEDAQHDDSAGSSSYSSKRSGSAHVVGFWIGPPALDGVWKEPASGTALDREFTRSHAALTQWGVVGKAGASCMQPRNCSAFDTTGNWKENALDLQAAKFRCAPSFVIPGTQKGASTFLFHALSRHPQVVPPLRGAHGYKEAGAYVLQNCRRKHNQIGNRVHRFPFLEPDEPFATGDGTVHYMISCPAIPGELVNHSSRIVEEGTLGLLNRSATYLPWTYTISVNLVYVHPSMCLDALLFLECSHVSCCCCSPQSNSSLLIARCGTTLRCALFSRCATR